MLLLVLVVSGVGFFAVSDSLAQTRSIEDVLGTNYARNLDLPNSTQEPRDQAVTIIQYLLTFMGLVAVVIILYGGFIWMTSNGREDRVRKAKQTIIGGVIGLIIIISAFTIVTYIIDWTSNILEGRDACGGLCAPGDNCCAGACCSGFCCGGVCQGTPCGSLVPGGGTPFRITRTIPPDNKTNVVRNVVVKSFFNKPVDASVTQAMLNSNFTVAKIADIDPVTGAETAVPTAPVAGEDIIITTDRKAIYFKALAGCANEQNTPNCFAEWSKFRATVDGAGQIDAALGEDLDCSVGGCQFDFSTSDLIDTEGPKAGIVPTQMCIDDTLDPTWDASANIVGGWGRDDVGISELRFYRYAGIEATFPGTTEKYQYEEYDFDTGSFSVGTVYNFSVQADDMAGGSASADFDSTLRVWHCCNGILDGGEEKTDCGGPDCDSCLLRGPMITYFNPDNGAVGNWITIGGRYFGDIPGEVYFYDGTGFMATPAAFPPDPPCRSNWQDNQIIVVVPPGADTGPVRVVRGVDGRADESDDANGPNVGNFTVNSIVRPGLCLVENIDPNPTNTCAGINCGYFDDPFKAEGISFSGSPRNLSFGQPTNSFSANNIANWTNAYVDATVPNLTKGQTGVFITVNGENSNNLVFNIKVDPESKPVIVYIDPPQGPAGQYITIFGLNFKTYQGGISKVEFTDSAGNTVEADGFGFPPQCQDKWWRDKTIIVKVPTGVSLGDADVSVTNRLAQTSDPYGFEVTSGAPGPGLCLLDPNNGPVGIPVIAYGDNFKNTRGASLIQFFNSVGATAYGSWANQKIETNVPAGAETGPVKAIIDGSPPLPSNALPFTVGSCTDSAECEVGEECCGGGTIWAGVCRAVGDCSVASLSLTGYGWSFTTLEVPEGPTVGTPCYDPANPGGCAVIPEDCSGFGQVCNPSTCFCEDPVNIYDSCRGRAQSTGRCDPLACPNSPGECSVDLAAGPISTGTVCSDADCNTRYPACALGCSYQGGTFNRCISATPECNLPDNTLYTDKAGNSVTAYCADYSGSGRWHFNSSIGCPDGMRQLLGQCVDETTPCEFCEEAGFSCIDDEDLDSLGLCSIGGRVCASGSYCAAGECVKDDSDSCECCCEVGQGERDCCAYESPAGSGNYVNLECAGTCGAGVSPSGTRLGECTGCAAAPFPDEACNCFGAGGKYCDLAGAGGAGVCRDCAQLSNPAECSAHAGSCCVDNMNSDKCRGGAGNTGLGTPYAQCEYFNCAGTDPDTCNTSPLISGTYRDVGTCLSECPPDTRTGGPEDTCDIDPDPLISNCDPNFCQTAFDCMYDDPAYAPCGTCCCNMADDRCPGSLVCSYTESGKCQDHAPGASPDFGLCCGCSKDSECSSLSVASDQIGCGTDTCCHERPDVVPGSNIPADHEQNVCRNAAMQVKFDQVMSAASFSGNVLLFGAYDTPCPAGTEYITQISLGEERDKGTLARLYNRVFGGVKNITARITDMIAPGSRLAQAYQPPNDSTYNYCSISIRLKSYPDTIDGNTILDISPSKLLEGSKWHYVVIRGDRNPNDDIAEGVLSEWGIGLLALNSPSGGNNTFNGVDYSNAFVYSFETMSDQEQNRGICTIDRVEIKPKSYLFKTTSDDNNEVDDDANAASFDRFRDRDKVYKATAKNSSGRILTPVPEYNWEWLWSADNPSVVDIDPVSPFSNEDRELFQAAGGVTDGSSLIFAEINLIGTPVTVDGDGVTGSAWAYVFICNNPWPPDVNGLWEPWEDTNNNCTPALIFDGCHNTNFKMYYCRDTGRSGTFDDLPALRSNRDDEANRVIRGRVVSPAGTTILKDMFFLREDAPDISTLTLEATTNVTTAAGGAAAIFWNNIVVAPGETLDEYVVYYGTGPGQRANSVNVGLSTPHSAADPFYINGLVNGRSYYFAITARYSSGEESGFSNEIKITPEDITAPSIPNLTAATPGDGEVQLEWDAVADTDLKTYKVYYGLNNGGPYGYEKDVGNVEAIIVEDLTNGTTYWFTVTAIDKDGNESGYANNLSAAPEEPPI